jgi:hypothetical protein
MLVQLRGTEKLAENIAYFARTLRRAGLPMGTGQIEDAQAAVQAAGIESREVFKAALAATLVKRHEHLPVFEQAFAVYWQNPRLAEKMMRLLLPTIYGRTSPTEQKPPDLFARVQQSLRAPRPQAPQLPQEQEEVQLDAAMSLSPRELLAHKDFETLSLDELATVRRELRRMPLPAPLAASRRPRPARAAKAHARVDARRTLSGMTRTGELAQLAWRAPRPRRRPLVVLADISGSMDRYTRLLLLFLHRLANDDARVEVFLFGTRLTRITRQLRQRDVDVALARAGRAAPDWAGGTRLTSCLTEFNQRWGRRVLTGGALTLLISDGLDAELADEAGMAPLGAQVERLALSSHRLLWLNPLLRYAGFEAKPLGVRAVLPHVHAHLPVHNLASVAQLAQAIEQLRHRAASPAFPLRQDPRP